jgi:hypothetical protein
MRLLGLEVLRVPGGRPVQREDVREFPSLVSLGTASPLLFPGRNVAFLTSIVAQSWPVGGFDHPGTDRSPSTTNSENAVFSSKRRVNKKSPTFTRARKLNAPVGTPTEV